MSQGPRSGTAGDQEASPGGEERQWQAGQVPRKKSPDRNMSSIHSILNDDELFIRRRSSSALTEGALTPPVAPNSAVAEAPAPEPSLKRGRGRPRKYSKEIEPKMPKRPRGRPRKLNSHDTGHRTVCENFIALSGTISDKVGDGRTPKFNRMVLKCRSLVQAYLAASTDKGTLTDGQAEELEQQALGG